MENIFNTLIESYVDNKVGITENFLSPGLAAGLKENLVTLFAENQLRHAGTGNDKNVVHDRSYRSDRIYWLDREHENLHENDFFELIERFVMHLNKTCYTGIKGYEFHYTLYEAGSFYSPHVDQFRNNDSRQYSMIMYLNDNWKENDGGELRIHHHGSYQTISPVHGKTVFFRSNELEHEVLVTHKPRMSITGWLKV